MSLRIRVLLACAAVVLTVVPGIAVAGAGTAGGTNDDAQIVADAKRVESAIVAGWNDKKWDELAPLYAESAVVLAPNHEPVRGRSAIIEYFRSVRDVVGEIADAWEYLRVKGNGDSASLVGLFAVQDGRVRMWYTDLYERQPDGSVQIVVNAFAFRERAVG